MRRGLVLLNLAVTSLVVVAFSVPIGILVRNQAEEQAKTNAERSARSAASLIALAAAFSPASVDEAVAGAIEPLAPGRAVYLSDGSVIGSPDPGQGSLTDLAIARHATVASSVPGGWELAVPVVVSDGVIVASAFVTDDDLTDGVLQAWLLLGLLGVVIVAAGVVFADRMGRGLVRPVKDLVVASQGLGQGDLTARVDISEPPEIAELGKTFNWLASRLDQLLRDEREAMADLSHGLRTPLTAMRLQADRLGDPHDRESMLAQVDRLENEVDRLITQTRAKRGVAPEGCDLTVEVAARCDFWRVLAEDQSRAMTVDVGTGPTPVALGRETVGTMVDALIGNVFSHTRRGTPFSVSLDRDGASAVLVITDRGEGWPQGDFAARGASAAGSTGLGLDIARKAAEAAGGTLEMSNRPGGGAVVSIRMPIVD